MILGKFGQILGMTGQDLGKMIKMLHNLPGNHEMIICSKFHPHSMIFDRVIAITKILGKFGQILVMPGQDLGKMIKKLHNLPTYHAMIIC